MQNFRIIVLGLWILSLCSCYESDPSSANPSTIPLKPENFSATAVSSTEILLTWSDNSFNEDGFTIEQSEGDQNNFIQICRTGPDVRSYTKSNCAPKETYFFRICSFNSIGSSEFSDVICAITLDIPPAPPTNLRCDQILDRSAHLIWTDNSDNEEGFKIDRKLVGGDPWAEVAVVLQPDTTLLDTGLVPGTNYYYKVRAYNAGGVSDYSNRISINTLEFPIAPSALTIEIISTTQLKLSWNDNSSNEDGFSIERKTENDSSWAEIARYNARKTTHTETNLTPNTIYFYRLRAFNALGYSEYSNEASAQTPGPPESPTNLSATVVSTKYIQLDWSDNSILETGFELCSSIGDSLHFSIIDTLAENSVSIFVSDDVLFTDYFFRIRAFDIFGASDWSNVAFGNTPDPVVFLGGLSVIDVSDPENPVLIGRCDIPGEARDIFISGESAYVADYGTGLVIIDISDKLSPEVSGSFRINFGVTGVSANGNFAYLTGTQSGFRILDVSAPRNIREVGALGTMASSVFIRDRYAFLSASNPSLRIVDVIASNNPVIIGSIGSRVTGTNIFVNNQYAYVSTQRNGLKIYRISDPARPIETGTCNINVGSVYVSGSYAYATSINDGLHIIDIRTPTHPTEIGLLRTPGNAWDVCVLGDYAYIADYANGLQIVNISDPRNPRLVGSLDTDGFNRCVGVVVY